MGESSMRNQVNDHMEALIADDGGEYRGEIWEEWQEREGGCCWDV
jgi:hypothetical protein